MGDFKISLEAARINAHLTQAEVAERLNVSPFTIANWESGKTKKIPAASLMALCDIYHVPQDLIFLPTA